MRLSGEGPERVPRKCLGVGEENVKVVFKDVVRSDRVQKLNTLFGMGQGMNLYTRERKLIPFSIEDTLSAFISPVSIAHSHCC